MSVSDCGFTVEINICLFCHHRNVNKYIQANYKELLKSRADRLITVVLLYIYIRKVATY